MSKRTPGGGPAFPRPYSAGTFEAWSANDGMSMRQHYAGIIMAGLCSNSAFGTVNGDDWRLLALRAVILTDALLKELAK